MNLKNLYLTLLVVLLFPVVNNSVHAAQKATATFAVGAMALAFNSSRENNKISIENSRGESFTFHGDGTVSVRGSFGEDLGIYRTNIARPLFNQKVQLVKDGNQRVVFVGTLGLLGGGTMDFTSNYKKNPEKYEAFYPVHSYHVSCKSHKPKSLFGNENLGGVVLYAYEKKGDWYLNNVHCKTGYIILQKTDGLEKKVKEKYKISYLSGKVHGAVYASVFGENVNEKVLGSGFSYHGEKGKKKTWKYKSLTFNKRDGFHIEQGSVTPLEEKWVKKALENWIEKGQQNTHVLDESFGVAKLKSSNYKSQKRSYSFGCI